MVVESTLRDEVDVGCMIQECSICSNRPPGHRSESWLAERGQPAFRAAQIRKWVFERRAESFEAMSDLPKAPAGRTGRGVSRCGRARSRGIRSRPTARRSCCLELADGGARSKCVLLRDDERRTICISTQVGCGMGCVFCASGLDGVDRNLTTGEIVEQMLRLQRLLAGRRAAEPHRRHGHGRAAGEPRQPAAGARRSQRRRRPGHQPPADHDHHRRPAEAAPSAVRAEHALSPGRLAARAERRAAQRRSCRSTRTSAWPRSWPRPTATSTSPAGG